METSPSCHSASRSAEEWKPRKKFKFRCSNPQIPSRSRSPSPSTFLRRSLSPTSSLPLRRNQRRSPSSVCWSFNNSTVPLHRPFISSSLHYGWSTSRAPVSSSPLVSALWLVNLLLKQCPPSSSPSTESSLLASSSSSFAYVPRAFSPFLVVSPLSSS